MNELPLNAILDKKTGHIIVQKPLPPFNCLVLEGAGIRGPAYAGAISTFARYGLLDDVQHVAGSSAGALAATIIALGYSEDEIASQLQNIPINSFLDDRPSWSMTPSFFSTIRKFYSIATNTPLSSGKAMLDWLKERVKEKLGDENATFADLARIVESNQNQKAATKMKYLYVTTTNIGLQVPECVVYSHETKPQAHTPIAEAAYASAAFPGVIAAISINGQLHVDGGCKQNLAAAFFDKRRFLPEGYDFTHRGANPGILSIKIDYTDEINQIIWGIKKPFNIGNSRDLAAAVSYAFTDNIDASEIRESRVVIPLKDNDISTFAFTIDTEGRVQLPTSAEDTTQDFLENHINSALDVIAFKSANEWLDALSLDGLENIINIYRDMKIYKQDADLENYITFLEDYSLFKKEKRRNLVAKFEKPVPDYHIDIKPDASFNRWSNRLKKEMEDRVTTMQKHLGIVDEKISLCRRRFTEDIDDSSGKILHSHAFEDIKLLTGFYEYKRILEDEMADLNFKLGVATACSPEAAFNHKYGALCEVVEKYQSDKKASAPLNAIINRIDIYKPIIAHKSLSDTDNILFTYNLRQKDDCKLFLIAAILYLGHRHSKESIIFEELYSKIFDPAQCPKDMNQLDSALNQQYSPLLCSAYRIEELMQYFERTETPGKKTTIDLDKVFGIEVNPLLRFFSKKASPNPQEVSIAMKNIFRTHPPRRPRLFSDACNVGPDHENENEIEMKLAK